MTTKTHINTLMTNFLSASIPRGLPATAYIDAKFWQVECDSIFANNWVFVGFKHTFVNSGDIIPITVAGQPIILVKNIAGHINAFHNACRHRCLQLVEKPKNVGDTIRCPYHAWAYNLDGSLRAAPFFGGKDQSKPAGFELANYGLKPINTKVWHDFIFVNLNGSNVTFADYISPIIKHFDGFNFEQIKPVAILDFGEIACNWKFLMENFIEPYHVQFVHRNTTNQPLKDHYTIVDNSCLGCAVDIDNNSKVKNSLSVSSRYLTLFPNFVVGRYFPDQLGVYLNMPIDAGRTIQKRAIYTTEGKVMTKDDIDAQKKLWLDVHQEDHVICERMQLGRASTVAQDGGILSPYWENSVHAFQKLVAMDIMRHNT